MKALFRQCGDKFYVWKDSEFKNGYFVVDSGYDMCETDVVAVKDTEGAQHVICNYCGEKILDNPESIERHFAEREAKKDCMTCSHCRSMRSKNKKTIAIKNDDGTYTITETSIADTLQCDMTYRDIDHQWTENQCMYNQCRKHGVRAHGSILMKYPDLFETQITNDLLLKKKYEYY